MDVQDLFKRLAEASVVIDEHTQTMTVAALVPIFEKLQRLLHDAEALEQDRCRYEKCLKEIVGVTNMKWTKSMNYKRREHHCGASGYDPMRDAPCPGCSAREERQFLHRLLGPRHSSLYTEDVR